MSKSYTITYAWQPRLKWSNEMIGTLDCNVQAKYPSMPLDPMQAYVGSPSSIRVRNVPKRIGDWQITSVKFVVAYPDASIKSATCKLVGGVWVGTVEGTLTSGTSKNGYSIFADGIDENGNEIEGYCLGKGDVEILKADGTIDPDAPAFYVKLLEEPSEDHKPGQMWFDGDELNIVDANGDVKTYEQPELSGYATKDELSAKQDKITASGVLSGDGQGNIATADMDSIISSTVLARDDVWTVAGFSGWTYQYRVVEQYGYYAGEEGWIYTVDVTSCDNPEWRNTSEVNEPTVSPTKLETFTTTLRDWGEYEYPIDTYAVTASVVGRNRNELGLVTYDDISVSGVLSGDGRGNITSADMSGYASKSWVEDKGYLTAVPSSYKTYTDTKTQLSTDGFATESWVEGKGYLTAVPSSYKTYTDTKSALRNDGFANTGDIKNPTITLTQGGATKGSFTLNQSSNQTIDLDAGGGGGGGYTVTVNFAEVEGDTGTGVAIINGHQIEYEVDEGTKIDGH